MVQDTLYKRSPFISLMRDKIILQLQLTTPGKASMTVCRKTSITSAEAATAWTWCQLEVPAPDALVLHVAPDGDDRADGRTPQRAFRTLARARDAVWFRDACQDCRIVRCHVYDCGSGGIRAGGTDRAKVSARSSVPPAPWAARRRPSLAHDFTSERPYTSRPRHRMPSPRPLPQCARSPQCARPPLRARLPL